MTKKKRIALSGSIICTLWLLCAATASAQSIPRSQLGSAFEVRYGTVDFDDNSITKVVTESGGIVQGDCVAVELGQTANIRRTSAVHCEHRAHEALADPIVHAKRQTEAAECHAAKQMALQATTEVATDIALKKVRVFCEG